jgi:hypothetical protein
MTRAFVLMCTLGVLATPSLAAPLMVGIHGGTSIPNLRDRGGNEISSGWSTRVAPAAGMFLDYGLTGRLGLRAEVNYVSQGGKRDGMQPIPFDPTQFGAPAGTLLYANFKNVAKLDYLEIPVLAAWSAGGDGRIALVVGPYVGFLVSAKTVTSGQSAIFLDKAGTQIVAPAQDFAATTNNKSDLNTLNWGLQAGTSVSQPLGRGRVSLNLRGELGLANIQKDTAANGKNGTGTLAVVLGYGVPIR